MNIRSNFHELDIHIHVPAGATPKDGPSAGVAMITAMISALSDQCVDPGTGMTGEITLSGRVLPVGGIREKVLAAYRAGLRRIILPARNKQDLDEVPKDVLEEVEFVFVSSIDELLNVVFPNNAEARSTSKRTKESPKSKQTKAARKKAKHGKKQAPVRRKKKS